MPINLTFYKFSERQPEDNQAIWIIDNSPFYGSYSFKYGKAEYSWEEYDEEGCSTGTSYIPEAGEPIPEGCKLCISVDGHSMANDDLWAPCEEIENQLPVTFED